MQLDPRSHYAEQLDALKVQQARARAWDGRLADLRLVVALTGLSFGAWAIWWGGSRVWPLLLVGVFAALVIIHELLHRRRARAGRLMAHYEAGLARIDDRWQSAPSAPPSLEEVSHPTAQDLDLFGPASLWLLLATTRTASGAKLLAEWLVADTSLDEARERQLTVQALSERPELFLALAQFPVEIGGATGLAQWAASPRPLPAWLAPLSAMSSLATAVTLVVWGVGLGTALPFVGAVTFHWLVGRMSGRWIAEAMQVTDLDRELGGVLRALHVFSGIELEATLAAGHVTTLRADQNAAAKHLSALQRLVGWLDSGRNQLFAPIGFFLGWNVQCAVQIEGWRARHGAKLGHWLHAVSELDALTAVALFSFEHPEHCWPALDAAPVFSARELAHPLVPRGQRVGNDVCLDTRARYLVISGSNMSGKSTLLRAVGLNVVLARLGARVCARELTLGNLILRTSIAVGDSLHDGRSRFYAELLRLTRVVEASTKGSVLFLIDEILSGTNSHERVLGTWRFLQRLLSGAHLGLLTTHDLDLTKPPPELEGVTRNLHFGDRLEGDALVFDYRLQAGPARSGNALLLMTKLGVLLDPLR